MQINLDQEVVQQAVTSALLDQLGADGQRTLVAAALTYLTTPKKDHYAREQPSPLQDAFNRAVGAAANKIVMDLVAESEEFQATIKSQVGEAFLKMESTNFSDYLGTALSAALKGER